MQITKQVRDELKMMERHCSSLNSTGDVPQWICDNCGAEYRPVLIPGQEDKYPRCPQCHTMPKLSDVFEMNDK